MMAAETSDAGKEVAKRAREETSEGGDGSDYAPMKQKQQQQGEKDVGEESADEEMVRWSSLRQPMTSFQLFHHFFNQMKFCPLNHPFEGDFARGLLDLVEKGHPDPEKLIGCGVESFRLRPTEMCTSLRTFFLVRKDGSSADFCFRSCINNILPLPEAVKDIGHGDVAVCHCQLGGQLAVGRARLARRRILEEATSVTFGPTKFRSSTSVLPYFQHLLLLSPLNEALDEEAHLMLLELLKKGDPQSERKIGSGIESFQVRIHPAYDSGLRSFYLVRGDGSMEDFCFINCVDNIFPLTEKIRGMAAGPCSCHHEEDGKGGVSLGYLNFRTSAEMVEFIKKRFQYCPLNTPIESEVSHMMLLELLKKGDPQWGEKTGSGSRKVQSFQIREHAEALNGQSFFIVWEDGSMEPFCVWTCMDNVWRLPVGYKFMTYDSRRDGGGGGARGRRGRGKRGAGKGKIRG